MRVITHQAPFLNLAFLLPRQFPKPLLVAAEVTRLKYQRPL
jgi:hypothetical protein